MITRLLDGLRRRRSTDARAEPAGVVVEYSPRADGDADPGEVVWTWVAYEDDPSMGKDRPVAVIGRFGVQLAAVALTSKEHGPVGSRVLVGAGPWDPQGRPSYAKIDRLLVVDPAHVRREGSALDRRRFDALVVAVRARHHGRLHPVVAGVPA